MLKGTNHIAEIFFYAAFISFHNSLITKTELAMDDDLKSFLLCFDDYKKINTSLESENQKIRSDLEWTKRQERILQEQHSVLQEELKILRGQYSEMFPLLSQLTYFQSENRTLYLELKRKTQEIEKLQKSHLQSIETLKAEFNDKQEKVRKIHQEEMEYQMKYFKNEEAELLTKLQASSETLSMIKNEKEAILKENNDLYLNMKLAYESESANLKRELAEANAKYEAQSEKFKIKWQCLQKTHFVERQKLKQQLDQQTARAGLLDVDLQSALKTIENLKTDLKRYARYYKPKTFTADMNEKQEQSTSAHGRFSNGRISRGKTSHSARGIQRGRGLSKPPRRARGSSRASKKLNLANEDDLEMGPYRKNCAPPLHQTSYLPMHSLYVADSEDELNALCDDPRSNGDGSLKPLPKKHEPKRRKLYSESFVYDEL
ncbi:uncharacterized protein LOC136034930 isoform X2 [Artemia franciscana]|uniref:uncharacterized protein LOC136034930 isoform X2 n=1 Tax=Artemia franciscana TaxID=6661 RepID=UPI0032DA2FA8